MSVPSPLERAVSIAGSETKLAEAIGTRQQYVNRAKRKRLCPAEWVLPIERATGVSRHDLRPDLYPREDTVPAAAE